MFTCARDGTHPPSLFPTTRNSDYCLPRYRCFSAGEEVETAGSSGIHYRCSGCYLAAGADRNDS